MSFVGYLYDADGVCLHAADCDCNYCRPGDPEDFGHIEPDVVGDCDHCGECRVIFSGLCQECWELKAEQDAGSGAYHDGPSYIRYQSQHPADLDDLSF